MLPEGIPGGVRVFSPSAPILEKLQFKIKATEGSQMLRIELTDADHEQKE